MRSMFCRTLTLCCIFAWAAVAHAQQYRMTTKIPPEITVDVYFGPELDAVAVLPAFLVTDDRRARRTAQARGLQVVGTIWVLERAAERELIDLPPVLAT